MSDDLIWPSAAELSRLSDQPDPGRVMAQYVADDEFFAVGLGGRVDGIAQPLVNQEMNTNPIVFHGQLVKFIRPVFT